MIKQDFDFQQIVLDRVERYDASSLNCFAFRRGTDVADGYSLALGNMVSGFPFEIEGVRFHNSECAYIAGMFSDGSERHNSLQKELVEETNGFMSKKRIRRQNEEIKREDWEEYNVQWMLYVVWCKVKGNDDFRKMLMALPDDCVIIEDSTFQNGKTADIWGTKNAVQRSRINSYKKQLKAEGCGKAAIKRACDEKRLGEWRKQGVFVGKNLMGKILMLCRQAVVAGGTPPIDFDLLRRKKINICGKLPAHRADSNSSCEIDAHR